MSVENIMTNFRAIMVYVFHFGLILSIEKFIQFDCCKGHLNKALIDQNVYVYCLFGTGWMSRFFLNYSSKLKPGANKINIAIITIPLQI